MNTINSNLPSVSALDAEALPRHRWYFFKEAFSPAIVDHAIQESKLDAKSVVFDPFSGSGTTPLAAGLSGLHGIGMEVNPFLRFVAKTKTKSTSLKAFDATLAEVTKGAKKGAKSPLIEFSTFSELAPKAQKQDKWLFNSRVLNAFEGGWQQTSGTRAHDSCLIRLCLIGAAMDSANAVKDGKCLRYKNDWKSQKLNSDDFLAALEARAVIMREDIKETANARIWAETSLGDSRSDQAPNEFDLCVTSPPYLNSFDYSDVYRPELFLGGFVSDMKSLRNIRLSAVRSHVQAAWDPPINSEFGKSYSEAVSKLNDAMAALKADQRSLWNQRLPSMIQAYFEDMELVLRGLRKKAKPQASVWLVVSTSAYAGVEFPVDLIIADIAGKCGWFLREVTVLRYLRQVAGQQWQELSQREGVKGPHLRESVVILDAMANRKPSVATFSKSKGH